MAESSSDPDDHETSKPGFFMKSTIKSISVKFPSVKNISTSQLWAWLRSPQERCVVLLDARPPEEYDVSHIENSHRVDYESENMEVLAQSCDEWLANKPNPTIVCYCSIGYRSSMVAKNLQKFYSSAGRSPQPEIYNLSGSLFQWANEDRPMVDSKGDNTHFAHPYSSFWGKLLNSKHRIQPNEKS